MKRNAWRQIVSLIVATLLIASCGGNSQSSTTTTEASGATTTVAGSDTTAPSGDTTVPPSDEPVTLTVYHSEEGFDVLSQQFAEEYKAETGVTVEFEEFYASGGELRAAVLLELESGSVQADAIILEMSELVTIQMEHDPFIPLEIPSEFEIPAQLRERAEEHGFMPFILSPYVIVYNTELVAEDEIPTSWLDLLDERWNGLIGLGDPELTSGAHAPLWFFIDHLADQEGFGWDYYEEIGKLNPILAGSHGTLIEQVGGGELQIGPLSYSGMIARAENGMPLDAVIPEEGVPSLFTVAAVFNDSASRGVQEVATAFSEWLASVNGQAAVQEGSIPYIPVRTDVPVREWDSVSATVDVNAIYPLDPVWVSEMREENIAMFRERVR